MLNVARYANNGKHGERALTISFFFTIRTRNVGDEILIVP